ncbi:MAG: D-sedoheptulose-7-phosphate isomerase [Anaerolineae bacterium]
MADGRRSSADLKQASDVGKKAALEGLPSEATSAYGELLADGRLGDAPSALLKAYERIVASLESGGTLYLCGNGGSMADALHISGELLKSFALPRPVPASLSSRLANLPHGDDLAKHLQRGLRVHVLGANPALASAVANDVSLRGMVLAQELYALGRAGDVLLALSTSGSSLNVLRAVALARALGVTAIGLTGRAPNPLSDLADIAVNVPRDRTDEVQELHQVLYHRLCLMLEAYFVARWSEA